MATFVQLTEEDPAYDLVALLVQLDKNESKVPTRCTTPLATQSQSHPPVACLGGSS